MARRVRSVDLTVTFDTDELLEVLKDNEIAEEAERRRVGPDTKRKVADAIGAIRRGDYVSALTILEREFFPKWGSPEDAMAALAKARGA